MTTGRINQVTVVKGVDDSERLHDNRRAQSEFLSVNSTDNQPPLHPPDFLPLSSWLATQLSSNQKRFTSGLIGIEFLFGGQRKYLLHHSPIQSPLFSLWFSFDGNEWRGFLESIDSHLTHPSSHLSRPHSAATTTTFKTSELIDWEPHTPINSTHLSLTLFAHKSPFTQSSNSHPPIKDLTKNPEKEIRETQ